MTTRATSLLRIFCSIAVLTVGLRAEAQNFMQRVFDVDSTNFPNPERGMYHHKEVRSVNYVPLQLNELIEYRNQGITLVMRVFYLERFVDGDISSQYLDNVSRDFETARQAGVKLLVRFAYTQRISKPYGDATPERVLAHIDQLAHVLRNNSDVIALVQAGFIGAWGEWYYTDHFSQVVGFINEQNWIDRKTVVDALLNVLPPERTVQVRTPQYKRVIADDMEPLTPDEAFSGSDKSRIGHHNDCFLASPNDLGTYLVNIDEEKTYIEHDTYFVPLGGETCGVYVPRSECPTALEEMKRLHWSYLNIDYHPLVISGFESNGCLPEITQELGYRFRMTKGSIQNTAMPGGEFSIALELVNDGWAAPYNPRGFEIVLEHIESGAEYFFQTNQDPRRWSISDTIKINEVIGIPNDMAEGSYALSVYMPDPDPRLYGNAAFSIRLANKDVWSAQTGHNSLGVTLNVDGDNAYTTYNGTNFFLLRHQLDTSLITSPIFASASANEVLLYWGVRPEDSHRVIERAQDSGDFETLAIIPGNEFYFIDRNVNPETQYKYRYHFKDGNFVSTNSPEITVTTKVNDPHFYNFITDGISDEWEVTRPLATVHYLDSETYAFRLFADRDSLNVLIEGQGYSGYAIFFDSDNNVSSGFTLPFWTPGAFDYLIRNDSLYKATDQSWAFVSKVRSEHTGRFKELSISLMDFVNLGENILFKVGVALTTDNSAILLPFNGSKPATFIRTLPALAPLSLEVSNSQSAPESRLVIEWDNECENCNGYVIERSTNADSDFEEVFRSNSNTNIFRDDSLTVNSTYYYRMYSYNETGASVYTDVVSAKTHAVLTGIETNQSDIAVFPNPVKGKISIHSESILRNRVDFKIYDAVGNLISPALLPKEERSEGEVVLDMSGLPNGFYIIWIVESQHRYPFKVLKN